MEHNNACIWDLAEEYCAECEEYMQYVCELEDSGMVETIEQEN